MSAIFSRGLNSFPVVAAFYRVSEPSLTVRIAMHIGFLFCDVVVKYLVIP